MVTIWVTHTLQAQISPDCLNAIPICNDTPVNGGTLGYGSDDFNGAATSGCLEQTTTGSIESNSAWYRFRTGASGQLGFVIGFDTSEDWDFALYQSDDCGNLGAPVRCNFFDNSDQEAYMGVGEDPTGNPSSVLFEAWLQVSPGQDYYLLINNFSNTNSGFSIRFTGEIFQTNPYDALDCSIISNLLGPPVAACDSENVTLDATTPNATSYSWYRDDGSGFQAISGAAGPTYTVPSSAFYRVEVVTPSGTIYSDVQVGFTASPTTYPVADEAVCSSQGSFDLGGKDAEALGGQNPGAYTVSYHASLGDALTGAHPIPKNYPLTAGTHTIFVRTTSVANADCFDSSRNFTISVGEPPVVDFPTEVAICDDQTAVTIGDMSPDPNYRYTWGNGAQTPAISVTGAGSYPVTISNLLGGPGCTTTVTVAVSVSLTPAISEILIDDLQQNNSVEVHTDIAGSFEFRIDDGPFQDTGLFTHVPAGMHTVTVQDLLGCGSVTESLTVVGFPKFFTPNGDGNNDLWQIEGIELLDDPQVFIYDRFGKLLGQLNAQSPGWDGTFLGRNLPASDYWFKLTYTDSTGQRVEARHLANHFSLKR